MRRRPPRSTSTATLFPYTTRVRSKEQSRRHRGAGHDEAPLTTVDSSANREGRHTSAGQAEGRRSVDLRLRPAKVEAHRLGDQREAVVERAPGANLRSEEHTSELQSLMRISYPVFCSKNKKKQ